MAQGGVILEVVKSLISVNKVIPETLPIEGGELVVTLMCKGEGVEAVIPENAAELEIRFLLPRYISAPVEAGQTVGKAVVLFKGKEVRSTDITVSETALSL